jgi:hypothetical protein
MHQFASSGMAYEEYIGDVQRIRRDVLEKLYTQIDAFKVIGPEDRTKIMNELFGTSTALGNYGRRFFEMLRKIRMKGWQSAIGTSVRSDQLEMVKVITLGLQPHLKKDLGELEPESECSGSHSQESNRVFNVMGVYDGLNRKLLKEWFTNGKKGIRKAVLKSGGLAHVEIAVNKSIEKVGVEDDELIKPWDPANYPHNRPTLILKGGADPVTAWGQAERFYTHGLNGPRTLIEFEGVGHQFYLPIAGSSFDSSFSDGTIILDPPNIPPGKTTWVTGSISNVQEMNLNKADTPLRFGTLRFGTQNRVLIKVTNTSSNLFSMPAKEFEINDSKFKGVVKIDAQEIPPGNAGTWLSGKITVKGADLKFTLEPPINLDGGLEFTSNIDTDSWNKVYVEITNKNPFSVDGEPRRWIYKPPEILSPNTACLTGGAGTEVNSLNCVLYAFVETEYPDFIRLHSDILDRIRSYVTRRPKSCWENGCDPLDN